jgi:hypothetical protein
MTGLSDHNSQHERIEVLLGTGSGRYRLKCTLLFLRLLLYVGYFWKILLPLTATMKQNLAKEKQNIPSAELMVYKWEISWI